VSSVRVCYTIFLLFRPGSSCFESYQLRVQIIQSSDADSVRLYVKCGVERSLRGGVREDWGEGSLQMSRWRGERREDILISNFSKSSYQSAQASQVNCFGAPSHVLHTRFLVTQNCVQICSRTRSPLTLLCSSPTLQLMLLLPLLIPKTWRCWTVSCSWLECPCTMTQPTMSSNQCLPFLYICPVANVLGSAPLMLCFIGCNSHPQLQGRLASWKRHRRRVAGPGQWQQALWGHLDVELQLGQP
jgi:hypothetical protein